MNSLAWRNIVSATLVSCGLAASLSEPQAQTPNGITVKTRYTVGAQVSENTTYVRGPRQRIEFPGVVTIDQCDLRRSVVLNDATRRYRIEPYATAGARVETTATADAPKTGGVVTYATTLTDTGERKPMYGLEARRIRTTIVREASGNACDKTPQKIEMDAWYVDLPGGQACQVPHVPEATPAKANCVDRIESRVTGEVKLGFPISLQTTATTGDGDDRDVTVTGMEVTDLRQSPLDTALFEIPEGYTEAKTGADLLPSVAKGGSLSEALMGSTAAGTAVAAPKRAGIIRVGVLAPVNRTERELPLSMLREELVSKYRKAPYEALPLSGDSPAAIAEEATRMECDYILFTEVAEVKSSKPGRIGGMLRRTSGDSGTQMKHDVRIDYKLYAVTDTARPRASGSGKASTGGFGVGSALRVAAFAGQGYMRFMGMGGLGGFMNPMMMSMPGLGGGLGAFGGMGLYDPRASAMGSMTQMALGGGLGGMMGLGGMPGVDGEDQAGLSETISAAASGVAKDAVEQLRKAAK